MKLKELFEISMFCNTENNDLRIYTYSNRYTNNLPTPKEIVYADRLIDKVAKSLLKKGCV